MIPTLKPLNLQPGIKIEKKLETPKQSTTKIETSSNSALPSREASEALLQSHVKNASLLNHCHMVATAMETYAKHLGEETELWYQTGLLHDLDWEAFPDEHPNRAINELLKYYPAELKMAIAEHAPERTGHQPESILGKYLFACDELSGFIHAVSLMRPTGMVDMKPSSVKKKMKDKGFAKNVSRDDIERGLTLINKPFEEHADFLIKAFTK